VIYLNNSLNSIDIVQTLKLQSSEENRLDYMYLVIENTKKSFLFPANKSLLVGNDADCDVQINHPKIWGRHFVITQNDYGCVLDVFQDFVCVNGEKINEKCILDTGDVIQIDELSFRLLDDTYIPKDSQINHTNVTIKDKKNTSSVYGIRSFSDQTTGQFLIDDLHHPDGWHVFRKDNELHFVDNKHKTFLNGLQIAQAQLSNGDIISCERYKYKIELPGTSGFSKFSPSHPRNVLLSESVSGDPKSDAHNSVLGEGFLKNNLWWLTLLVGLGILVLIILNNPG
jgi:pSer/pThr/pTyr-binding forkhead associated (FHA) protein